MKHIGHIHVQLILSWTKVRKALKIDSEVDDKYIILDLLFINRFANTNIS